MTQAFSLWGELTVRENFVLDARLYQIPPAKAKSRIDEMVHKFGLEPHLDALAGDLPMGLRQRLSLAVAVLHEPQILILDEPTSGVDPVAQQLLGTAGRSIKKSGRDDFRYDALHERGHALRSNLVDERG